MKKKDTLWIIHGREFPKVIPFAYCFEDKETAAYQADGLMPEKDPYVHKCKVHEDMTLLNCQNLEDLNKILLHLPNTISIGDEVLSKDDFTSRALFKTSVRLFSNPFIKAIITDRYPEISGVTCYMSYKSNGKRKEAGVPVHLLYDLEYPTVSSLWAVDIEDILND